MKSYKNVDEYIKKADKSVQDSLRLVRNIVVKSVPKAEEGIVYGMPAYKLNSKPLFYFAAMKGHLGLYPTSQPIEACRDLLKDYSTSKGCVRVPWNTEVPKKVIIALLKERVKEIK
jgi:uncharacterized protein YdhG (YjbR/CyaY superfamily)